MAQQRRQAGRGYVTKKRHNKQLLQQLITEQQRELNQEKKLTCVKGRTKTYEKSTKGFFIGNRIF